MIGTKKNLIDFIDNRIDWYKLDEDYKTRIKASIMSKINNYYCGPDHCLSYDDYRLLTDINELCEKYQEYKKKLVKIELDF